MRTDRAIEMANRESSGSNVSVFIMTCNEEANIRRCLDSVRWSNDVVVLDSFSEDDTIGHAASYPNVRIFYRRFDDYGSQRNHGLHAVAYRNRWLLVLDADEVVEPALATELREVARRGEDVPVDVFLLRRKVFMDGRCVRWNVSYDFWLERFVRPSKVAYEGVVHEKLRFEGGYRRLTGALEHHQFSKGIDDWLARRRKYARLEAEGGPVGAASPPSAKGLFSRCTLRRRTALKALFHRMPARWAVYFAYNLFIKFAFLDGLTGLRYIFLEAYSLRLLGRQARNGKC